MFAPDYGGVSSCDIEAVLREGGVDSGSEHRLSREPPCKEELSHIPQLREPRLERHAWAAKWMEAALHANPLEHCSASFKPCPPALLNSRFLSEGELIVQTGSHG